MRIALERRAERQRRRDRMDYILGTIKEQSMQLQIDAHEHASKSKDKYGFAATLINAGARGFFGRLLGKEQRLQSWGALKIQCAYRGMIGRMRAEEELSLIHISEPTRPLYISYAVFCLKKKK